VTTGRYITIEVLTGSLLGVPWSPWLFPLSDFGVQERIDRGFGVGAHTPMTHVLASHCQNPCTTVTQVESIARETDHSICQGEETRAGVGIRLALLHVGVYAFSGGNEKVPLSDSLTVAHQLRLAAGLYGRPVFLDESAAVHKKVKFGEW